MKITCIMCPLGCNIEVNIVDGQISCENYGCKRGIDYSKQEMTKPQRVVTSLAVMVDGSMLPCKTDGMVDKEIIFKVLKEIKGYRFEYPIKMNQILIENILNSGVNVISTVEK